MSRKEGGKKKKKREMNLKAKEMGMYFDSR